MSAGDCISTRILNGSTYDACAILYSARDHVEKLRIKALTMQDWQAMENARMELDILYYQVLQGRNCQ